MDRMTITHTTSYAVPTASATVTRTGPCPTCGRTTTRKRTATVPVGNRTYRDAHAEAKRIADMFDPEPAQFEHDACQVQRETAELQPVAPQPRSERDHSVAVLVAEGAATAAQVMREHQLYAGSVQVDIRDAMPRVEVVLFGDAGEFLRWVQQLPFPEVQVEKDSADTMYVRAYCEHLDVRWAVHTSLYRQGSAEQLPGAQVVWNVNSKGRRGTRGTLPVPELADALRARGVAEVLPR